MRLAELNKLELSEIEYHLKQCCNAKKWYTSLANEFPFRNKESLLETSDKIWEDCDESDWMQAFEAHPRIGDVETLAKKFANTKEWAGNEQSGMDSANNKVIELLAEKNDAYFNKFGFIFIVFATGKSAQEMLDILEERLPNNRQDELKIAAQEQHKITTLRIEKLLE